MLWQLAYAEIYFLDKLWPDFNNQDLKKIIKNLKKLKKFWSNINADKCKKKNLLPQ